MNQYKKIQLYCLKKEKENHSQYGKISAPLILMEHGIFVLVFFWICKIFNVFKRLFSSSGFCVISGIK